MTSAAALLVVFLAGDGGANKPHEGTRGGTTFGAPTPTAPTRGPGSTPAKDKPKPDAGSGER